MKFLIAVFCHSFMVMARFTKRLPVILVPKKDRVTAVGNNMVHYRSTGQAARRLAADTQRMPMEECFPCLLPLPSVPFLAGALCVALMKRSMVFAVHAPIGYELWTARVLTWSSWTARHGLLLPRQGGLAEVTIGRNLVIVQLLQVKLANDAMWG